MPFLEGAILRMQTAVGILGAEIPARRALSRRGIAAILVALFAGFSGVLVTTRWGIGASPDSVAYLGVAHNLMSGRGLSLPFGDLTDTPLTRFPPLYPMLLAGLGQVAADPVVAARWLQAALFAANAALVAVFVARVVRPTVWAAALGSLLLVASPAMLEMHSMAWSEPLFLFLGTASLLLTGDALGDRAWKRSAAAGALAGLACLTRYAGISLLATGGLALWLWGAGGRAQRLRRVAVFLASGGTLPLLWMVRNLQLTGNAAARPIVFHPVGMPQVWQAVDTIARWLQIPRGLPGILEVAVILLVAAGVLALLPGIAGRRKAESADDGPAPGMPGPLRVALLHVGVYAAFLVASVSLVDANTPLDARILSPVYPIGIVAVASGVTSLAREAGKLRTLLFVVLAGALLVSVAATLPIVRQGYQIGLGFNRTEWQDSPTLARVGELPDGDVLYSNSPEAIYFRTGRRALPLPQRHSRVSQGLNQEFAAEVAALRQQVAGRGGAVVFFRVLAGPDRMSEADLHDLLGLERIFEGADGSIYADTEGS